MGLERRVNRGRVLVRDVAVVRHERLTGRALSPTGTAIYDQHGPLSLTRRITVRTGPPYLLSALAIASLAALVVGCIETLQSGRADQNGSRTTDAITLMQAPVDTASSQGVASGSASVSSSSMAGGRLVRARVFRVTNDGCYEIDPAVEGDPPGLERSHKIDCPFEPPGFDSR
jgi:hypothetical protein